MELRKLDKSEHGKTRDLWERVFEEDTKAFLDYYYFFKTRDNEIFVIEEDGEIRSMLHLNPYTIQVEEEQFAGHYIIAVATDEAYRKRGYMGQLLHRSMQEMYNRKEMFTFLVPAAEAIYLPYDFRFVYDQNVWVYTIGNEHKNEDKSVSDIVDEYCKKEWIGNTVTDHSAEQGETLDTAEAGIGDGVALAGFFNTYFAEMFQVYAVRDENYYQTVLFEQQSENGGIRLLKKEGEMVGSFLYADEDGLEIREPLYYNEYENEFWDAVSQLCEERRQKQAMVYAGIETFYKGSTQVAENECTGYSETEKRKGLEKKKKPTIMVRILHLESLLKALKVKEGEEINCSFAVLDSILPQNSRIWRLQSKSLIPTESEQDLCAVGLEDTKIEKEKSENEEADERKVIDWSGDLHVQETEDSEGVLSIAALTSLLFGYKSLDEVAEEENVYLTEHLMEELKKIQPLKTVYLNEIV